MIKPANKQDELLDKFLNMDRTNITFDKTYDSIRNLHDTIDRHEYDGNLDRYENRARCKKCGEYLHSDDDSLCGSCAL